MNNWIYLAHRPSDIDCLGRCPRCGRVFREEGKGGVYWFWRANYLAGVGSTCARHLQNGETAVGHWYAMERASLIGLHLYRCAQADAEKMIQTLGAPLAEKT